MGFINVKNKKGTSSNTPPTGFSSWIDYWKMKKGKRATICEANQCRKRPELGGHVIVVGRGGKEYILPICYDHNNKPEDEIYRAWEDDLIPVN